MDLFSANVERLAPLADRMRPRSLDEFLGQSHIVGRGRLLRRAIEADRLTSSIFFGPPGTGKTTLASIIASTTSAAFEKLNAVTSGVADMREVIKHSEDRLKLYGQPTYLLLDECHRWNKAQSDSILPAIEKGIIRFIGSTTENPMIAMTPAIVSRCRIFQFRHLNEDDIKEVLLAALADKQRGFGSMAVDLAPEALAHLAFVAGGDARSALNALELAVLTTRPSADGITHITADIAAESIQQNVLQMDESYYYDMMSAFIKSMRGADTDAALAWFARMITAGIDPRIVVRRIIVHASEDVGMANPQAMLIANAAWGALEHVGLPEARIPITQAIITISESPKSNSVVAAMGASFAAAERATNAPVPIHLRDTSYKGHERIGSGEGYKYPHDYPGHWIPQRYMPDDALGDTYYRPSGEGGEADIIARRLEREELRKQNEQHGGAK